MPWCYSLQPLIYIQISGCIDILVYQRHSHSKHRIKFANFCLFEGDSIRSTYFVATSFITQYVSVSMISIKTFKGILSFWNRKKLSRKNCKMCHFSRFLRSEVANFLSNRMSCIFSAFFYFLHWTSTLRSKLLCFCEHFECVCQL